MARKNAQPSKPPSVPSLARKRRQQLPGTPLVAPEGIDVPGVPRVPKPTSILHPFQLTQPLEQALSQMAFTPIKLHYPKRHGGRPTDLNDAIAERICLALRYGAPRSSAAEFAGVLNETLKTWLRKSIEPYLSLRRYVEEAESFAQMYMLNAIYRGVWADAKHAFEYLSRRWPDRYGPPAQPNGGQGGTTVNIAVLLEEITQRKIQDPRRALMAKATPVPVPGAVEDPRGARPR